MNNTNVSREYAKIIEAYLKEFGLEPIDLAYLVGTKKDVIDGLISQKNGVVLNTLEKIAAAFGVRYYQIGDPAFPVPTIDMLPEKTKGRIRYREFEGASVSKTYNQLEINEKMIIFLASKEVGHEFLAEQIVSDIAKKYDEKLEVGIVNDRLNKTFNQYVKKTEKKEMNKKGSGPKPSYYQLIKEIPDPIHRKAQNTMNRRKVLSQ